MSKDFTQMSASEFSSFVLEGAKKHNLAMVLIMTRPEDSEISYAALGTMATVTGLTRIAQHYSDTNLQMKLEIPKTTVIKKEEANEPK